MSNTAIAIALLKQAIGLLDPQPDAEGNQFTDMDIQEAPVYDLMAPPSKKPHTGTMPDYRTPTELL